MSDDTSEDNHEDSGNEEERISKETSLYHQVSSRSSPDRNRTTTPLIFEEPCFQPIPDPNSDARHIKPMDISDRVILIQALTPTSISYTAFTNEAPPATQPSDTYMEQWSTIQQAYSRYLIYTHQETLIGEQCVHLYPLWESGSNGHPFGPLPSSDVGEMARLVEKWQPTPRRTPNRVDFKRWIAARKQLEIWYGKMLFQKSETAVVEDPSTLEATRTEAKAKAVQDRSATRARAKKRTKDFRQSLVTAKRDPVSLVRATRVQLTSVQIEEQEKDVAAQEATIAKTARKGKKRLVKTRKVKEEESEEEDHPFIGYDAGHLDEEYGIPLREDEPVILYDRYFQEAERIDDEDYTNLIPLPEERKKKQVEDNIARFWKAGINFGDD